jgi:hypothetical protein
MDLMTLCRFIYSSRLELRIPCGRNLITTVANRSIRI